MAKRRFIVLGMVLACAAAALVAQKSVTLSVWDFKVAAGDAAAKALQDLDVQFEASHPGVKIEHVGYPSDPTYYATLQAAATSNTGPDVVMFHADNARLSPFASVLATLNPDIADVKGQFTAASLVACTPLDTPGQVKLLPMTSQGFGIYYNKALFKKAGLDPAKAPKNSADFLAACAKLKAAGIVPILTGKDYTINFLFRTLVANIVGSKTQDLNKSDAFFAGAEFKAAAEFVKTLVDKEYIEKEGLTRTYFMEAIDSFAAGNGAIFVGLLSDVANWKSFSDGQGVENIGFFPTVNLPGSKNKDQLSAQPAGIGLGIFTWTKQKKLSVEYIKFITTGAGAGAFSAASGALSPNTKIASGKVAYPVLPVISGYLKTGFSNDYQAFGQSNFEGDLIRLVDQAYVSKTMTIDKFVMEAQKAYHAQ